MANILKKFESVGDFSSWLKNGKTQNAFQNSESSKRTDEGKLSDCKTRDYNEADNLFLYGDKTLQKKIEDAGVSNIRLKLRNMKPRRQIYSSVCGVAANVPNAIAGIPTAMINVREVRQKQRVLNICYNCSCSGSVSANDIINTSAQFISALMLIEASGVQVNLYLSEISRASGQMTAFLVRIKSAGQPFDVLKMAYPMAHPSMLRRHFFRALEIAEGVNDDFSYGYGSAVDSLEAMTKALGNDAKKMNYICCFYDVRYFKAEDIAKKIVEGAK